jgi:hypothetical protein
MSSHPQWLSLRELDEQMGLPKGSAFRAFKRMEKALAEGGDFEVLEHERDREQITRLRAERRIYASSVNVVLLSAQTCARLAAALTR